MKTDSTCGL